MGKTANTSAAATSTTATAGRHGWIPRAPPPPCAAARGPHEWGGAWADHRVPASSQNAPVAGDPAKLNTTHTVVPAQAELRAGTAGSGRASHGLTTRRPSTPPRR